MTANYPLTRRSFLAVPAAAFFAQQISLSAAAVAAMKDAYKNVFLIGTAVDFRRPDEFTPEELALITSQFNAITPENSMKPGPVHPQEDTWNWTTPDALLSFCADQGIKAFGHTLVWHAQTNPWFFENATRDLALARLRTHIHTLVGRYKGKISGWDVVNEAINDGGDATTGATENLRDSRWLQTVGPDFLTQAFRFAREADPNVPLHYNDYSIESGFKHQSSLVLLKRLIADGAPITTVGIQGHWSLAGLTPERYQQIDDAIAHYKALKLKVAITELDVTLSGAGGGQLGGGRPRHATSSTDSGAASGPGRGVREVVRHLREAPRRGRSRHLLGLARPSVLAIGSEPARVRPRRQTEAGVGRDRRGGSEVGGVQSGVPRIPLAAQYTCAQHVRAARVAGPAQSIVAARGTMASMPTGLD